VLADGHSNDDYNDGIEVRDACCEADENVHVGLTMSKGPHSMHVEIPTCKQLQHNTV